MWLKSAESVFNHCSEADWVKKVRNMRQKKAAGAMNLPRALNKMNNGAGGEDEASLVLPELSAAAEFALAHALHLPHTVLYAEDRCARTEKDGDASELNDATDHPTSKRSSSPLRLSHFPAHVWQRSNDDQEKDRGQHDPTSSAHDSASDTAIHPVGWFFSRRVADGQREILRKNRTRNKEEHLQLIEKCMLGNNTSKSKRNEAESRRPTTAFSPARTQTRPGTSVQTPPHAGRHPSSCSSHAPSDPPMVGRYVNLIPPSKSPTKLPTTRTSSPSRPTTRSSPNRQLHSSALSKPSPSKSTASVKSPDDVISQPLDIVAQYFSLDTRHDTHVAYLTRKDMEQFVENARGGRIPSHSRSTLGMDAKVKARPVHTSTSSSVSPSTLTPRSQQHRKDALRKSLYDSLYNDMDLLSLECSAAHDLIAAPGTRPRKAQPDTCQAESAETPDQVLDALTINTAVANQMDRFDAASKSVAQDDPSTPDDASHSSSLSSLSASIPPPPSRPRRLIGLLQQFPLSSSTADSSSHVPHAEVIRAEWRWETNQEYQTIKQRVERDARHKQEAEERWMEVKRMEEERRKEWRSAMMKDRPEEKQPSDVSHAQGNEEDEEYMDESERIRRDHFALFEQDLLHDFESASMALEASINLLLNTSPKRSVCYISRRINAHRLQMPPGQKNLSGSEVYERVCCFSYAGKPPPVMDSSVLNGLIHTRLSYICDLIATHIHSVSRSNLTPIAMTLFFSIDSNHEAHLLWADRLIFAHELLNDPEKNINLRIQRAWKEAMLKERQEKQRKERQRLLQSNLKEEEHQDGTAQQQSITGAPTATMHSNDAEVLQVHSDGGSSSTASSEDANSPQTRSSGPSLFDPATTHPVLRPSRASIMMSDVLAGKGMLYARALARSNEDEDEELQPSHLVLDTLGMAEENGQDAKEDDLMPHQATPADLNALLNNPAGCGAQHEQDDEGSEDLPRSPISSSPSTTLTSSPTSPPHPPPPPAPPSDWANEVFYSFARRRQQERNHFRKVEQGLAADQAKDRARKQAVLFGVASPASASNQASGNNSTAHSRPTSANASRLKTGRAKLSGAALGHAAGVSPLILSHKSNASRHGALSSAAAYLLAKQKRLHGDGNATLIQSLSGQRHVSTLSNRGIRAQLANEAAASFDLLPPSTEKSSWEARGVAAYYSQMRAAASAAAAGNSNASYSSMSGGRSRLKQAVLMAASAAKLSEWTRRHRSMNATEMTSTSLSPSRSSSPTRQSTASAPARAAAATALAASVQHANMQLLQQGMSTSFASPPRHNVTGFDEHDEDEHSHDRNTFITAAPLSPRSLTAQARAPAPLPVSRAVATAHAILNGTDTFSPSSTLHPASLLAASAASALASSDSLDISASALSAGTTLHPPSSTSSSPLPLGSFTCPRCRLSDPSMSSVHSTLISDIVAEFKRMTRLMQKDEQLFEQEIRWALRDRRKQAEMEEQGANEEEMKEDNGDGPDAHSSSSSPTHRSPSHSPIPILSHLKDYMDLTLYRSDSIPPTLVYVFPDLTLEQYQQLEQDPDGAFMRSTIDLCRDCHLLVRTPLVPGMLANEVRNTKKVVDETSEAKNAAGAESGSGPLLDLSLPLTLTHAPDGSSHSSVLIRQQLREKDQESEDRAFRLELAARRAYKARLGLDEVDEYAAAAKVVPQELRRVNQSTIALLATIPYNNIEKAEAETERSKQDGRSSTSASSRVSEVLGSILKKDDKRRSLPSRPSSASETRSFGIEQHQQQRQQKIMTEHRRQLQQQLLATAGYNGPPLAPFAATVPASALSLPPSSSPAPTSSSSSSLPVRPRSALTHSANPFMAPRPQHKGVEALMTGGSWSSSSSTSLLHSHGAGSNDATPSRVSTARPAGFEVGQWRYEQRRAATQRAIATAVERAMRDEAMREAEAKDDDGHAVFASKRLSADRAAFRPYAPAPSDLTQVFDQLTRARPLWSNSSRRRSSSTSRLSMGSSRSSSNLLVSDLPLDRALEIELGTKPRTVGSNRRGTSAERPSSSSGSGSHSNIGSPMRTGRSRPTSAMSGRLSGVHSSTMAGVVSPQRSSLSPTRHVALRDLPASYTVVPASPYNPQLLTVSHHGGNV